MHQIWKGLNSQGCCLTATRSPEAPTIPRLQFTLRQPKFQTGSPNGGLIKSYDSQANFQWTKNKIPRYAFCTFEMNAENINLVVGYRQKKISADIPKVNKQAIQDHVSISF